MPKKPVLLHFHIFKNAGMTFGWVLENNFQKDHVRMDDIDGKVLGSEIVKRFIEKYPSVKAFSCHNMDISIQNTSEIEFIKLIFIREPIDRACSIYSYNKNVNTGKQESVENAKKMKLQEYIEWHLENNTGQMQDTQTKYLTGFKSKDVEVAIKNLKETNVVCVVDRFDESMVIAEEHLKTKFPNVDLSYVIQNVTSENNIKIKEKIDGRKKELGVTGRKLEDNNKKDYAIYAEANKELDIKIQDIPDLENKLYNFRQRCIEKRNIEIPNSVFRFPRLWYAADKDQWFYKGWVNKSERFFD